MDSSKKFINVSPEEKAGVVSKLFYLWFLSFFKFGYKNDIQLKHVYNTTKLDLSGPLTDDIQRNWEQELRTFNAKKKKPSLANAIVKTFYKQFMLCGVATFVQFVIMRMAQSLVLAKFIGFFDTKDDVQWGWIWGSSVIIITFITVVIAHNNRLATLRIGMRVRIAVCSLIYRKLLTLSHCSLSKTTTGHLINLLSNDVQRFDLAAMYLHYIWITPITIMVAFVLLYNYVGITATVAGMGFLILETVPFEALSKWQGKLRYQIAERTDRRVKLMNEITTGIHVIKMYAWEKPFQKVVKLSRKLEVNMLTKTSYIYGIVTAMGKFTERVTLYVTIVVYLLVGNKLTSDIVFSAAQLFNSLQSVISISFPKSLSCYCESKISIKRLEKFLTLEEKQEKTTYNKNPLPKAVGDIELINITANWTPNYIVPTLTDITLHIKPGKLCCIVGNVGSGKSSILQLLLKELPHTKGQIMISGNIAYASQEPWLFVSNVRDNILFGKSFQRQRYEEVVRACSLQKDFKQLPFGDKTLVGERGNSLSGGQRARVNLARAVYTEADIYLLDDPLSAVDTKVGRHLFDDCIVKYLKGKTRVLVTHQLQFMKRADLIVIINHGRIEKVATFNELTENELNTLHREPEPDENNDKDIINEEGNAFYADSHQSTASLTSSKSFEGPQEKEELIEKGAISSSVYVEYWRSGAGIIYLSFAIAIFISAQIITNASDLWLRHWTNTEARRNNLSIFKNTLELTTKITPLISSTNFTSSFNIQVNGLEELNKLGSQEYYIWIYTILIVCSMIFLTWRCLLFFQICMNASKNLHNRMFSTVLQAPMRFFDTNPSGRILSRFSKDMGAIDEQLTRCQLDAIQMIGVISGTLTMVFVVSPWMIIPAALLGLLNYYFRVLYLTSCQPLKRLEGVTRAPVFSHISATLNGITTIRASRVEKIITKEFDLLQDQHTSTFVSFAVGNTVFGFYLDVFCCIFLTIVTFQFLIFRDENTMSGNVGLAMSQCVMLIAMIQFGFRMITEVENNMISVERVLQYTKLEKEGPFESVTTKKPPRDWPSKGKILFKNAYLRYEFDLPPVLKNLNIEIYSGEKIGIVGRTGAGKSSLIASLFRLAPVDGVISIDEINTAEVGLNDLRLNISIIPQEPVLFSGSVRYNLDPFGKHSDDVMWKALENVELKDTITDLNQPVSEGGANFSTGQKQLICLARAIVRDNKILVLDEATANVDPQTDALIQKTIRERFRDCTVLTVAHRLNTIMDSDRVLVIDAGEAIEFGHPHELLQNSHGSFTMMVKETGPAMEEMLKTTAAKYFYKRNDIMTNVSIKRYS